MSDLVVHGIPGSPFLRAVMAVLEEKSATYRFQPVTPGDHRSEAYRAMHPFARVPVIQHGDFTLYETQAILRYLDATFSDPPLQPTDPRRAARMDQLMGISDWYFFPKVAGPIVFQRVIGPVLMGMKTDEAVVAAAVPDAALCIATITDLLGDQPFLTGDTFSLADLHLYPQLFLFGLTPEGRSLMDDTPLADWMSRMAPRPCFQATLPPPELRDPV